MSRRIAFLYFSSFNGHHQMKCRFNLHRPINPLNVPSCNQTLSPLSDLPFLPYEFLHSTFSLSNPNPKQLNSHVSPLSPLPPTPTFSRGQHISQSPNTRPSSAGIRASSDILLRNSKQNPLNFFHIRARWFQRLLGAVLSFALGELAML